MSVVIDEPSGDVTFDLELTTPACPVRDKFVEACKNVLQELVWVKNVNVGDDYDNENIFTKEDIQVLYVPHTTKKSLLFAFDDISMIVNSKIHIPEFDNE